MELEEFNLVDINDFGWLPASMKYMNETKFMYLTEELPFLKASSKQTDFNFMLKHHYYKLPTA